MVEGAVDCVGSSEWCTRRTIRPSTEVHTVKKSQFISAFDPSLQSSVLTVEDCR